MQTSVANFAKTLAPFIVLTLFSSSACAEVNKWTDEKGVVHYSDTRPSGVQTDSVRNFSGKEAGAAATTTAPKTWTEREAELKKSQLQKKEADEKQAKKRAAQAERLRNCANAQESLRTLESGSRIATYDANGEKVYLDDATRELRIQAARQAVQANCD